MDTSGHDFNAMNGFGGGAGVHHNSHAAPGSGSVPELTFGGGAIPGVMSHHDLPGMIPGVMTGGSPAGGVPGGGGGKCQVYDGATCALYVGNSSVYISSGQNQAYIEQRMTEAVRFFFFFFFRKEDLTTFIVRILGLNMTKI
jgi:hypothetical protein